MKFSKEPNLRREPRLSEQVADFLASEIELESIRAGDLLPSEAELSYRFNVSRAVIREALARLKQQGVLQSRQGSRTRVASGSNSTFKFRIDKKNKTSSIVSLYEFKILLEADAAALAAVNCEEQEIAGLQSCLATLTLAMEKGLDGTSANFDFHQTFIEASHNRYLIEFMKYLNERLWDLLAEDKNQPSNLAITRSSLDEHIQIFQAIANKAPEQARKAIYAHLKNAAKRRGILVF